MAERKTCKQGHMCCWQDVVPGRLRNGMEKETGAEWMETLRCQAKMDGNDTGGKWEPDEA